ncbi:MAG: hypothetical protein PHD76_06345 [Methylacidiphilales bacterium]|nr:hypothetical protein [Candidatus Methylacidiphilales bacterium]
MTRTSNELDGIKFECLNLLIVYLTYRNSISEYSIRTGTRFDLHRWRVQLRVLENDLILRLCRLDDDDKTNHSLREALRSIRDSMPQQDARLIDKRLKSYRQSINELKVKARNYFLAHMSKDAVPSYDPQGGLEQYIQEVVNIVDAIAGKPVSYLLKVGSQEPQLDLKFELSSERRPIMSGRLKRSAI